MSVELKNWRSHKHTKLSFSNGTNLLLGTMGSGKSSVLDGITFGLFGTFPALERRRLTIKDVVMFGERNAAIVVELQADGSIYRIERELGERGVDARLYKDGKLTERGTRAVTTYTSELLNTDYDLFTRAIYSNQNNITYFVDLEPRKRKLELDELFGLNRIEIARANLVSVMNKIRDRINLLKQNFSAERYAELARKVEDLEKNVCQLAEKLASLEEREGRSREVVNEKKEVCEKYEKMKKEYDVLREREVYLSARLLSLSEELDARGFDETLLPSLKETHDLLKKKKQELLSTKQTLEEEMRILLKKITERELKKNEQEKLKKNAEELKKKLDDVLKGKTLEWILKDASEHEEKIKDSEHVLYVIGERIRQCSTFIATLSEDHAQCPLCGSSIGNQRICSLKEGKQVELEEWKIKKKEQERKKQEYEDNLTLLRERIKLVESIMSEIFRIGSSIVETPFDVEGMKKEYEKTGEKKKQVEASLGQAEFELSSAEHKLRDIMMMKKTKEQADNTRKELETLRKRKFSFDEKEYEHQKRMFEESRRALEEIIREKNTVKPEKNYSEEMLSHTKKEKQELEALKQNVEELERLEGELSLYRNVLLETQTSMRREIIETMSCVMNEVWPIVYPYKDYEKIRVVVDDKDYNFEIYRDEWKKLDGIASGGEKTSFALAFRIALATTLIPDFGMLILDEPTHNLDRNAVATLAHVLQYQLPKIIKQTFVITHDESLSGSDFAKTYKFKKEFGKSMVEET